VVDANESRHEGETSHPSRGWGAAMVESGRGDHGHLRDRALRR
jgi:hypothetical protein